jgi:hypothetical protein
VGFGHGEGTVVHPAWVSVGEPCCGGSSISAWGRESGAATTAGTSGGSRVVEGTDLGRVLGWHTAWGARGSGLGWGGGMHNVGDRSTFVPGGRRLGHHPVLGALGR